jgi:hypothetical protein
MMKALLKKRKRRAHSKKWASRKHTLRIGTKLWLESHTVRVGQLSFILANLVMNPTWNAMDARESGMTDKRWEKRKLRWWAWDLLTGADTITKGTMMNWVQHLLMTTLMKIMKVMKVSGVVSMKKNTMTSNQKMSSSILKTWKYEKANDHWKNPIKCFLWILNSQLANLLTIITIYIIIL